MADEAAEESAAPDTETAVVEDEPRADPEQSAVEDGPTEAIVPENVEGDEEEQEQQEQAAMPEGVPPENAEGDEEKQQQQEPTDVPPETVGEQGDMPPETVETIGEQADVPPETVETVGEQGDMPPETAGEQADVPPETAGEQAEIPPEIADEQADMPPETVDEPQPDAAGADESGAVPPEPESGGEPLEEAGIPEADVEQQLDSTEAEVVVPAVTDEEPVAAEFVEPQEDEGLLEVADDDHEESVSGQPSDLGDEGIDVDDLGEDVCQSAEQLADEPSEVVQYPSADEIDILGEEAADLLEAELDELAELDEGDEPDPTREAERIGPVQECPDISAQPSLLMEGHDDIETPTDEESAVPSVLVRVC